MNGEKLTIVPASLEHFEDISALLESVGLPIEGELKVLPNLDDIRKRTEPYELLLIGGVYHLKHLFNGNQVIANGPFVFVVPVSAPYQVRIGERIDGGHTSLSRGGDVYFAGEITFKAGALIEWRNESGHYHPPAGLQTQIRNLLPLDRFVLAHI